MNSVKAPKLSGKLFLLFVTLLEFAPLGDLIVPLILKSSGFGILDKLALYNSPVLNPVPNRTEQDLLDDLTYLQQFEGLSSQEIQKKEMERIVTEYLSSEFAQEKGIYPTVIEFHNMYKKKLITPLEVAQKILESVKKSNNQNPPLMAVIKYDEHLFLAEARASTERYEKGTPISVFDGVPVTIKDELDVAGYTTSKGMKVTEYTSEIISLEQECNVSKSLRTLGAIFVGKANQNEIGICGKFTLFTTIFYPFQFLQLVD